MLIPTRSALAVPASIEAAPDVQVAAVAPPGRGSETPIPPSASKPLPTEDVKPAVTTPAPATKPLENTQTAASDTSKLRMPVQGRIIRTFEKGKNEGISISANAGDNVVAADYWDGRGNHARH